MLTKPFLAKCTDRTALPKSHPTSGTPEDWFSETVLKHFNLTGITFDFFVNWNVTPQTLTPIVWIKRILRSKFTLRQAGENIEAILIAEFGAQRLQTLKAFGANHNLKIQFIIFNDDSDWSNPDNEILIANFENHDHTLEFTHSIQSLDHFKSTIRKHSGGRIIIGSKGLIYGTSRLECHLSGTDSLYPGDVDLLILDSQNRPFCILEFKKHTLSTSIALQQLSNFYPNPDARKYNRLAILKNHISQKGADVPMFTVYYPTRKDFKEGKLELLKGHDGNLSTCAASNFPLPSGKSSAEYKSIIEKLIKAVAYHHSLP